MLARLPVSFGIGVSLAACIVIAAAIADVASRSLASLDFIALYAASRLVTLGRGGEVLDADAVLAMERAIAPERVTLLPYVHPPAVALLLAPLAGLPFAAAYASLLVVGALCLCAAALLLAGGARRERRALLLAFALIAPPSALALAQGQTTTLILLLVAGSLRAPPALAGLLLGLTALRPQTLPLLAIAALGDRRRAAGFVVGASLVVLASALVVGGEGLARYAAILVNAAGWSVTGELGLRASIGWVGGALALGLPALGLALVAASLLAGAIATARAKPADRRVAIASVWSLLASPHALLHDGLLAYPAAAQTAADARPTLVVVATGVAAAALQLAGAPLGAVWLLALAAAASLRR